MGSAVGVGVLVGVAVGVEVGVAVGVNVGVGVKVEVAVGTSDGVALGLRKLMMEGRVLVTAGSLPSHATRETNANKMTGQAESGWVRLFLTTF